MTLFENHLHYIYIQNERRALFLPSDYTISIHQSQHILSVNKFVWQIQLDRED